MITSIALLAAVALAALVLRFFRLRLKPPLEVWHRRRLREEFRAPLPRLGAAKSRLDFAAWLALEERLFSELDREIYASAPPASTDTFDRYQRGSRSDPLRIWPEGNRTFERAPTTPRGAALLIHGLTDSPYTVRSLAPIFERRGLHAVAIRLPGHGTAPSGLAVATRQDWRAAVRLGLERASERAGGGPVYVLGYSAGGTLALDAILEAIESGSRGTRRPAAAGLPIPRRLFLISPAIGITYLARLANWHKAVSFLPGFEKAGWLTLAPEYDPFKYNSHHKNGGDQLHLLCKSLKRRLRRAERNGSIARLPPVLTFQSAVDATVLVSDLLDYLYARLDDAHHELVLFDTNRWSSLGPFLRGRHDRWVERLKNAEVGYRFTLVTNRTPEVREVVARSRPPRGAFEADRDLGCELGLQWPAQVYSLSHVALPFPPDDPTYGGALGNPEGDVLHLGTAQPRGERDLLRVPIGQLMRLRYNPFHSYLADRIDGALEQDGLRRGSG
jgi:alpha-beta hydrolase superfamily lysophospholipase